jgi:hypothetical protein
VAGAWSCRKLEGVHEAPVPQIHFHLTRCIRKLYTPDLHTYLKLYDILVMHVNPTRGPVLGPSIPITHPFTRATLISFSP